ncbi:hypothetical protein ACFVHW_04215 [Streptomyces sp. NPDC127110]|uniref:hypothetical protein n=1 Tax=Streptomyces sp. NPDC127110 TaxID=3345362 RepID=UPI00362B875B
MSIDFEQLRADAAREVDNELAAITDPFQRRAKAEELREQADAERAALTPERNTLLAAAALYEPSPNLHLTFGIMYQQLQRITGMVLGTQKHIRNPAPYPQDRAQAARDAGLPHPDDLLQQATQVAARYEAAEARQQAAIKHLAAAQEAVRTAGGRVDVGKLERPDFDEVRRRAVEEIRAEFATLAVSLEQRLRQAAEAVDQAEEEMAALLPERHQAMASLSFYTTARAIYESAGCIRPGMMLALRQALGLPQGAKLPPRADQPAAARAAGVKFMADAAEALPDIAVAVEAAKARRTAAIEIRDAAVLALYKDEGWTAKQLAEAIDRDVKIVRRVIGPSKG